MAAAYEFAFFGQEVGCACRNRKCVIAEERAGEADSVIIPSVAARAELDPSEILSAVCVQLHVAGHRVVEAGSEITGPSGGTQSF